MKGMLKLSEADFKTTTTILSALMNKIGNMKECMGNEAERWKS
jgi:hypothetical protein